jgi:hypothetical protein
MVRPTARRHDGAPSIALGVKVGYWPCLRAPFLQVCVYRWRVDVWHGLPSKQQIQRDDP